LQCEWSHQSRTSSIWSRVRRWTLLGRAVRVRGEVVIKDPRPKGRGIHPSGRYLITPQAAGNVPEGIQAAQLSSEDFWRAALPLISGAMSSALRAGQVQLAARIRRTVETLEPPGLKRSSISPVNWPISGEGRCGFQSGRGLEADRRKRGLSTHVQVERGRKRPVAQGLKPATWLSPKPPYGKSALIRAQPGTGSRHRRRTMPGGLAPRCCRARWPSARKGRSSLAAAPSPRRPAATAHQSAQAPLRRRCTAAAARTACARRGSTRRRPPPDWRG
jgi:hypothetical protein